MQVFWPQRARTYHNLDPDIRRSGARNDRGAFHITEAELPIVIMSGREDVRDPSERELARKYGIGGTDRFRDRRSMDVATRRRRNRKDGRKRVYAASRVCNGKGPGQRGRN